MAVLEEEFLESYALPLFKVAIKDDQDYVRFMAVNTSISLCNRLPNAKTREHVLPAAKQLATDNAWRVRYMAAERFCDVSGL